MWCKRRRTEREKAIKEQLRQEGYCKTQRIGLHTRVNKDLFCAVPKTSLSRVSV